MSAYHGNNFKGDEWIWENIQQNKLLKVVINFLQKQINLWERFTNEESDHK